MARKKSDYFEPEVSPGELYSKIVISRDDFAKGEKGLVKRVEPGFVLFCKAIYKRFPSMGKGAKFTEKYSEAINFLRWDLKPEEFSAAAKFVMFLSMFLGILAGVLILFSPVFEIVRDLVQFDALVYGYIFAPFIILALYLTVFVQQYPIKAAQAEQTKALGYVPEIVGYMIMSMKLVPNLEKAVEFAAEHGRGKIAEDFKRLLWETQIGIFKSLSEGLDDLAYRWGQFSDEFKHALMMIRASVLENTEGKRYQLLDKTMETVLDSIKNKMEQYARNLSQPSTMLFYVGVLLPLILIIILPVGSAFSGTPMAMPPVLIAIYNIGIPIITLIFARAVIKKRPPTYVPPKIDDNFPELPKKGKMLLGKAQASIKFIAILILVFGILLSVGISQQGLPPKALFGDTGQILPPDPDPDAIIAKEKGSKDFFEPGGKRYRELIAEGKSDSAAESLLIIEKQKFFMEPKHDATPYILVFGVIISISLAIFVFVYYSNVYKRKVQQQIMQMESEFKDSLYILASRLGENKPVEEALKHTKNFLPNLIISQKVFSRIVENIELLGMPLSQAVFDKNYGALKNVPSTIIQSSMRILVDSVKLGVNVAARTLISLSLQLRNSEKVNKMLSTLISDIVSMMKTMVIFIAPIVLGVTTSLQKIVMITLAGIASSETVQGLGADAAGGSINTGFSMPLQGISVESFAQMVTPVQFLIIVTIYVIELVIIMSYFTTKIEEDNDLLVRMNIAKALPIAVTVFLVAVIASNIIVGGFFGGAA